MQSSSTHIFNTIPTYFPNVAWYYGAVQAGEVVMYTHIGYNRKWHANKMELTGANGTQFLSIPLVGGRMHKGLYETTAISYDIDWQKNHWRSIETMYGRSAYFEYFASALKQFFATPYTNLVECNIASIQLLNKCMGLNMPMATEAKQELTKNIALSAGTYPHKLNYTQSFADKYAFVPNLSMLDMLLCNGPQCVTLLKNTF